MLAFWPSGAVVMDQAPEADGVSSTPGTYGRYFSFSFADSQLIVQLLVWCIKYSNYDFLNNKIHENYRILVQAIVKGEVINLVAITCVGHD